MTTPRKDSGDARAQPAQGGQEAGHKVDRQDREYGHSSGDRNPRTSEDDWHESSGGEQRDANVDGKD